jgi:hypothetical protein
MLIPSIGAGPALFIGAFSGFVSEAGLAALFRCSTAGFGATLFFVGGFLLAAGFAGIGMDMPGIDCAIEGASRTEAAIEPQSRNGRSFKRFLVTEMRLRRLTGGAFV